MRGKGVRGYAVCCMIYGAKYVAELYTYVHVHVHVYVHVYIPVCFCILSLSLSAYHEMGRGDARAPGAQQPQLPVGQAREPLLLLRHKPGVPETKREAEG